MCTVSVPQRKAGRAWRTLRASILEANPYCAIRGPRCTVWATTVDHVVPVTMGGAELDPGNCRPACARCNYGGGARITNARRAGRLPATSTRRPQDMQPTHSPMWCTQDGCTLCAERGWGDYRNRY